jgi:hypothetical protein
MWRRLGATMLALLGMLTVALAIGKVAHRITLVIELMLLLCIAVIVFGEFVSWTGTGLRAGIEPGLNWRLLFSSPR